MRGYLQHRGFITGISKNSHYIKGIGNPSQGLLKGPNYSIKDTVRSDGLINTYELETKYGPNSVESTVFLLKRLNELKAIDSMEKLQGRTLLQRPPRQLQRALSRRRKIWSWTLSEPRRA